MSETADTRSVVRTIGWAGYLGSSWTWCIGMFLPLLLMRDLGLVSFLVFAIPNVLGAAAMGTVLRDGMSERVVASHRGAVLGFSVVTVAFQTFFLTWMLSWLGTTTLFLAAAAAVLTLVSSMARPSKSEMVTAYGGVVQWLISAAVLAAGWFTGVLSGPPRGLPPASDELFPLAAVCVLGFVLCPYLDVTFHHARQRTAGSTARWAFGLGFCVFFAAMIAGTVLYSGAVLPLAGGVTFGSIGRVLLCVLGLHIGLQLLYTIRVHAERWTGSGRGWMIGAAMLGVGIGLLATSNGTSVLSFGGMSPPETCYRLFMAFYGLVFPAYVWLCMIPSRGEGIAAPSSSRLGVLAAAVVAAAPCYWLGFIERRMWWLALGVAIVVAARVGVKARAQADPLASV